MNTKKRKKAKCLELSYTYQCDEENQYLPPSL